MTSDCEKLDRLIDEVVRMNVAAALVEFAGFDERMARKCAAIMKIRMQPFYGA